MKYAAVLVIIEKDVGEGQHVRELAQLDVAHVGRAFVGLQGDLQLVVHVVIAQGGHFHGDGTVGVLAVPALGSLLKKLLMLGDERPHRQGGHFLRGRYGHRAQQHTQNQSHCKQFLHGDCLLIYLNSGWPAKQFNS